ncbi:MAG: helix-turn-helix transcriptional regulator [Cognatishimia sp.]|uniref:winged helix-turn-helix transcriptional regulator n=1 Tax=Cognatishimia sp. TaxID=2211648 RepID=UPI003B8BB9CC
MAQKTAIEWNGCPVRYAAGVFGDKWSFVLLRDVLLHGKRYYGEFLASEEGISTNILATRLAQLEETGMLTRHKDPEKRSRVFYLPTRKARDLLPAFLGLMVWSVQHDSETQAPSSFAPFFNKDPKAAVAWYELEIDKVNTKFSGKI